MTDAVNSVYDWQRIEIYTKQILGKKAFRDVCVFWQNRPGEQPDPVIRHPVRLYIINDGSCPGPSPSAGSPVKSVRLCKRAVMPDYPKNTITGSRKSRITHRFSLVLLVEYENGEFKVITLPRQLSAPGFSRGGSAMVFSELISPGTDNTVSQNRNDAGLSEKLTLVAEGNILTAFEYALTFPLSVFEPEISPIDLENPTLQSIILLSNLRYEADVVEPYMAPAGEGQFVWTTAVDFILYEDITIKLGIEQDILVQGLSEG
ncbi:MAG TPA: hypothetical protein PLD49_03325 [Thermoclostridium caenicola]|uniref:Uncharacterized protein n=1 Tax=Thermoclostridium caenicola TaxID=659425 RepID=A0A1M6EVP1_9FIRM|nr:hypothetical protein [Thermoclostridium caenicola]SHI89439.1 hypothetical protein SAMN05444373_10147 [Thermoclostridium caenicola]HOK42676.1 hypothetical protein [Thermoclostridium caenicola]HOL83873.1 hypothetical protein [Thermoclostridium caenicola]HOP72937.1 hypothetical protein [Thermoclostridium caenicola]HPO75724.1 hypothetical protein [Thermoclostridium caenicola]